MRSDKEAALKAGIPPSFRRYSAHYGRGTGEMINLQKRFPASRLDHGRDRRQRSILAESTL